LETLAPLRNNAWLESCLLANRFPGRAGTPAAALIKLFAGLGSNKAGGEK
jgi:hypothetical protein